MTASYHSQAAEYAETFQQLNTDDKLAVLWHVYRLILNESGMENPNENVAPDSSDELFEKAKGHSEDEQLQLMRDLLEGKDTEMACNYNALTNNTKLAFWYQLAQGMDSSDVVQYPSDYQLSSEAQELISVLKPIGFQQQYVFMRDALLSDEGKSSV